jgi:alpha-glucosidase
MLVVYESAFTVICDSPYNYRDQPGSEFLKLVPVTWSETRYIDGYPGKNIIMARRKGNRWFVGGMTNEDPRNAEFTLDFLGDGNWVATLWKDAPDSDDHPAHLEKETFQVQSGDPVSFRMGKGGGFVMMLDPS